VVILPSFSNTDGAAPTGSLIQAANRSLYGTTYQGGPHGVGAIFEISHICRSTAVLVAAPFRAAGTPTRYEGYVSVMPRARRIAVPSTRRLFANRGMRPASPWPGTATDVNGTFSGGQAFTFTVPSYRAHRLGAARQAGRVKSGYALP
jgi:hypothetical protein